MFLYDELCGPEWVCLQCGYREEENAVQLELVNDNELAAIYSDTSKTKQCTHCRAELPADHNYFHLNAFNKDGLSHICKDCASDARRKTYQKQKVMVR